MGVFIQAVAQFAEPGQAQAPGLVDAVGHPSQLATTVAVEPPVIGVERRHHRFALDAFDGKADLEAAGLAVITGADAQAAAIARGMGDTTLVAKVLQPLGLAGLGAGLERSHTDSFAVAKRGTDQCHGDSRYVHIG